MSDKINLENKFQLFDDYWSPKILGEVNNSYIKIFKAKGKFVWHRHKNYDEFFLIVKGQLFIKLKKQEIVLNKGEFFIVPKGIDHLPYAIKETQVLLFEHKEVINTGKTISRKTIKNPKWI